MIQLKPFIDVKTKCPFCESTTEPSDWKITGMHSVCSFFCSNCKKSLVQELPVNAGLFYPGILDSDSGDRCDKLPFNNWYLDGLVKAYRKKNERRINLEVIDNQPIGSRPILLLNTIDATYGHALYELFNTSFFLTLKDFELILIVQKELKWLIPANVPQVWVVDVSFAEGSDWFEDLANQVKLLTEKFDEVYLCRSFVQADSSDFNISDYSKIEPFPLDQWDELLAKPTVTFIWRTDRFWTRVLPKWIDNRVTRKLFPTPLNFLRRKIQFRWIIRFSKLLKGAIPKIDFAIAGMDNRKFALPSWIKDYRFEIHSDLSAYQQCKRYSESHLIIGCNGSSLLLPGCHSGAVVNIVPGDQWAVSAGTFGYRITSIGDTHFRYQLVPEEISKSRLVKIVTSILRDRSYILLQTSPPWRDHNTKQEHFEWSRFRVRAFQQYKNFEIDSGMISRPKAMN